ncbi:CheR family methyltransferase [Beggiatoa leptomitoformis]|uniref:Chemotaxis protein methyltransferase n=1 Tax=Beggiatoa leptomitoformis TaxID=288004 RepID=A0A2N9YF42_9GAMM|nr:protein-glutamate O-methyltransferase CheR [Beggiatoa leptomitoformis]ALG68546.1 chemotaxis protein CheR [Beggiatoa leptomitoformis]AUI69108.1 chemotaxis protein CheR [Beggiatoa leptomitoformis]
MEREFRFTRQDFDLLRELVNEETGISLSDHKQEMLYSRLSRRLRVLKIDSFTSYYNLLRAGNTEELIHFVNAVTTNLTAFFREPYHFEYLAKNVLPDLRIKNLATRRIRIWSAGCASGEEAYSIAMVVKETMPQGWDVKILATDLDSNVLQKADKGIYEEDRLNGLSPERLRRWFKKGVGSYAGRVIVVPELKEMILFKQLNLMDSWPIHGPFDLIFCRNVVIYFNKETQKVLFSRFADVLGADRYLFIGHSENLFQLSQRFRLLQRTMYIRTC